MRPTPTLVRVLTLVLVRVLTLVSVQLQLQRQVVLLVAHGVPVLLVRCCFSHSTPRQPPTHSLRLT